MNWEIRPSDRLILDAILFHEGSAFTDDPVDAGGKTRWGITEGTLAAWYGRPVTEDDVRNLERSTAEAIYRARYIKPFDSLPESIRANVIDAGVNSGTGTATRLLQQAVGATVDGVLGMETLRLTLDMDAKEPLNEIYTGFRLAYYENLIQSKPTQNRWRNGWRRRALSFTTLMDRPIPKPSDGQSVLMAKADV